MKTDAGKLVEKWREENVEYDFTTHDWTGENLVFELKSHPSLNSLGSFPNGWFYIQDPSTLLAIRELDPQPGETILDMCAAPAARHFHRPTDEQPRPHHRQDCFRRPAEVNQR
ncbi:MAG: hypothetical protein WDN00_06620 [Limisphaerales bacterium]